MLNHKPTAKLTWSSDVHVTTTSTTEGGKDGKGMLSIVVDEEVPVGTLKSLRLFPRLIPVIILTRISTDSQVFNTYGAKSNEELLLGYGFVLSPQNPADCLAVKLSLPPNCFEALFDLLHLLKLEGMRHLISRKGGLPDELKAQMRLLLSPPEEIEEVFSTVKEKVERGAEIDWREYVEFLGWETELDMLDSLEGMLGSKMMALQTVDVDQVVEGIREEVREMIRVYRQGEFEICSTSGSLGSEVCSLQLFALLIGQIDILEKAIEFRDRLMGETMEKAEEDGVELDFEGEDDEE